MITDVKSKSLTSEQLFRSPFWPLSCAFSGTLPAAAYVNFFAGKTQSYSLARESARNRHAKQKGEQCAHSHDLLLIAHVNAHLESLRYWLEYCHPQFMPVPE
jgi:hypothetical protein